MIEIRKPNKKPIVVIRAATGNELSHYEKRKLANIEDNVQMCSPILRLLYVKATKVIPMRLLAL